MSMKAWWMAVVLLAMGAVLALGTVPAGADDAKNDSQADKAAAEKDKPAADKASHPQDKYVAYVSVGGEKRIVSFELNPATGKLTPLGNTDVGGTPGALAINDQHNRMYAAIRSGDSVCTLSIDPKTGELKTMGSVPLSGNPTYLLLDRSGKYLMSAYFSTDRIAVNPIKSDGTVESRATTVMETGKNPHAIVPDPANQFVYVTNMGGDAIVVYRFDPTTGKLAPIDDEKVTTKPMTGPRHLVLHPTKNVVYFSDERGSSASAYSRDPETGALTYLQTVTTLPEGYDGKKNTCADVEITPDGKFLYVSNRGYHSLACFKIDPETGKLTSLGQVPTEMTPREFAIDPTGNFVLSAGEGSGNLATYRRDPETGKLTPLDVYRVGDGLAWVTIIKLPGE